jgi:hypothetical protein
MLKEERSLMRTSRVGRKAPTQGVDHGHEYYTRERLGQNVAKLFVTMWRPHSHLMNDILTSSHISLSSLDTLGRVLPIQTHALHFLLSFSFRGERVVAMICERGDAVGTYNERTLAALSLTP